MSEKTRREFLNTTLAGAAGLELARQSGAYPVSASAPGAPAILGGKPVRTEPFPFWPVIQRNDEEAWTEVLRRKRWCRLDGTYAKQFEQAWANTLGAKYCLATASGTTALITSLHALDIGPGDEVLVPPYTFVATVNAVLLQHALPIFVDTDRETCQIDAGKIESMVTPETKCILPVHLGGSPADMDRILECAKRRGLAVIEDACQAHLAEWRHKKAGTLANLGCFSFQASKNLNSGEGGAILTNDERLFSVCESFHNNGRGELDGSLHYVRNGSNHRMTEFQATLLLAQLTRLESQSRARSQNAEYLTRQLREIPGIAPARVHDGCTRNAFHLYMFRYDRNHFAGLARSGFIKALEAEGVPCSPGYTPLNKEPFIEAFLNSRAFQKIYTAKELESFRERNHCPENDKLCEEAVWFFQTMLLGSKQDMDQIAGAIRKIQSNGGDLARHTAVPNQT